MTLPAPRADWTDLAATPRRIPASTRLAQRVGLVLFQMAALSAMLSIFSLVPVANCDLPGWLYFRGPLETAPGRVVHVERDGMFAERRSLNTTRPILRCDFEFEQGGQRFTGRSYTSAAEVSEGAACEVEFAPGKPGRARIRGMRSAPFGLDVLFFLLLPALAFGLLVCSQQRAKRVLRLLEDGQPATGRLLELVRHMRGKRTARVEYALRGGELASVEIEAQTPALYGEDRGVRLLVDPREPARAIAFDDLPLAPGIDELGNIRPTPAALLAPYLILPGLVVAAYAAFAWWLATRS